MEEYTVSDTDKALILETFQITEKEIDKRIEELQEWTKNFLQLPEDAQDPHFLDIMLLRGKFRDELVKKNIKNYYKTIPKYPEIFAKLGTFDLTEEVGVVIPSPQLTSNWERIAILKLSHKNLLTKKFNINQMILVTVTTGIIMYNYDYVPNARFLLDFEGFTLVDLFKVNVRDLFKLVRICENMLRVRISGIELLNAPGIVNGLLRIANILLKPKMFERITVHHTLESVYTNIPQQCLPSDYGGSQKTTEALMEIWNCVIKRHRPFFEKIAYNSTT